MSARVNLAPEVYQHSQRNKQRRKTATLAGIIVCSVALGLVVVSLVVVGGQKIAISTLQGKIDTKQEEVAQNNDELETAVTAQQHLNSLEALHQNKVRFSQFFTVLQGIAPQGIAADKISISQENILEMSGTARSYDLVTKFAKALEASKTPVSGNKDESDAVTGTPYFTDVALTSVSRNSKGFVEFKLTTLMSSEVTATVNTEAKSNGN